MECTDCVQWHLLHREALPGSVQKKPAVQSAGMSSQRHLKKSEIRQIHIAFRLIKKWPFLAKSQASKEKRFANWRSCVSLEVFPQGHFFASGWWEGEDLPVYTLHPQAAFWEMAAKTALWLTRDLHWITLLPNQDSWLCTSSTGAVSWTGGKKLFTSFYGNWQYFYKYSNLLSQGKKEPNQAMIQVQHIP